MAAAAVATGVLGGSRASSARDVEAFPSLSVAIARARTRPVAVIAARGAARVAEAAAVGARLSSVGNPYLEVFADRGTSQQRPELVVQSNLWIPVDISGQRSRRIEENDRLRHWRGAETEAATIASIAHLVRCYGVAVVAAERVRFLETIVAMSAEEAALYEARLKVSDATTRDAKLAAVDLSRNRMTAAQARADLARALAELARATGAPGLLPPQQIEPAPTAPWVEMTRDPQAAIDGAPALTTLTREAEYFAASEARDEVEGHAPLNLIVSGGQGATGGARLGGGLAWTFPVLRRNQGERARAAAEQARARDVAGALRGELLTQLRGLFDERQQVLSALDELRSYAEPAARAAVEAAQATERAGKGELLHVVMARRDLVSVRVSGLSLQQREWLLLGDLVSVTGRSP
jgi:cobalt-zinc-cadmium efflux system outer membrane protein